MNPLEEKAMKAELEKDRRRGVLAIELGYAEELRRWNQQHSCTHYRDSKTGDAQHPSKGGGAYTTQGQMHGNDTATLLCLRCCTEWKFIPTPAEREYILNGPGMMGFAPPPVERCINKDQFVTAPPVKPEVSYQ